MYSSEDLERFYFQYQTEALPHGESLQSFCVKNKVPYNIFQKWYRDTRKKVVEVQVDGAPVIGHEEQSSAIDQPQPVSPGRNDHPVRIWVEIRISNGLHLGIFKKKRFEPSFALGIALTSDEVVSSIELTQEQFAQYASGNVVTLDQTLENGWYQLLVDGNGFGFAKVIGNTLKNYYPKGLRFHI